MKNYLSIKSFTFLRFVKTDKAKTYEVLLDLQNTDKVKQDGDFVVKEILDHIQQNDMEFKPINGVINTTNCVYPIRIYADMNIIDVDYPTII